MAGANLGITTRIEDRRVREALKRLENAGGDMPRAMRDIGEELLNSTRGRFEAQQDPEGNDWAPLSDVTKARKRKNKGKILAHRGGLYGRLTWQAGDDWSAVGTPLVYGAAMHFGMAKGYAGTDRHGRSIPWGDIPARPYLGLSSADRRAVVRILHGHIRRTLRA